MNKNKTQICPFLAGEGFVRLQTNCLENSSSCRHAYTQAAQIQQKKYWRTFGVIIVNNKYSQKVNSDFICRKMFHVGQSQF